MKKYLPIIIFVAGLIVILASLFLFLKTRKDNKKDNTQNADEEINLVELSFDKRPFVSLTPKTDGHYLVLSIEKLNIDGVSSIDYELLYDTKTGVTQGVPGTFSLDGKSSVEADLLLGSESSGKFRYDDGVEKGSLTIWLRNDKGKLIAKEVLDFKMFSNTAELQSIDNEFKYTFKKKMSGYFVIMNTWGFPESVDVYISYGPYGIFSSLNNALPGEVSIKGNIISFWNGEKWETLSGTSVKNIGIFIGTDSSN